jgi:hypothetical protein
MQILQAIAVESQPAPVKQALSVQIPAPRPAPLRQGVCQSERSRDGPFSA